jgi:lipopolysaccharide transport system permease protein
MPPDNFPYPIFSFAVFVPWTFFANSLVGSANLIRKDLFPPSYYADFQYAEWTAGFRLAFVVLLLMMVYFDLYPTLASILWLPLFLLLALVTCLGVGLWLAAVNAEYRDIRYVVPFLTQFWLFVTPIAYSSSILEEPWRTLYGLNPMVGVVEGFRWALLGRGEPPRPMVAVSALVAVVILLVSSLYYFRRMEKNFADIL